MSIIPVFETTGLGIDDPDQLLSRTMVEEQSTAVQLLTVTVSQQPSVLNAVKVRVTTAEVTPAESIEMIPDMLSPLP